MLQSADILIMVWLLGVLKLLVYCEVEVRLVIENVGLVVEKQVKRVLV
jgi:hypothetical protein